MQTHQGLSPEEIQQKIFNAADERGGELTSCFSSPPPKKTIEAARIEDCHPGLLSHKSLGEGAFGQVESVTVDPSDSSSHGNLYSGLETGKTYALKHFMNCGWASPLSADFTVSAESAHEDALREMCIGREAGEMGVGPKVYGAWFCDVNGLDYGFVLMKQLQMSVSAAIDEAGDKNLIFTPDAQKSLLGLTEKFFMGGYNQVDSHFENAGVDTGGRFKLLDFGIVQATKWEEGKKTTEQQPKILETLSNKLKFLAFDLSDDLRNIPYFKNGKHKDELVGNQIMGELKEGTYVWGSLAASTEKVVYPFPKNKEEENLSGVSGGIRAEAEEVPETVAKAERHSSHVDTDGGSVGPRRRGGKLLRGAAITAKLERENGAAREEDRLQPSEVLA
uniref:Protein kinase domain-containing protein n=1 Tax=Chromera velia CCMP2878 TaxID=1169474 RepID=A0A0G4H983_9ALVE|eukprot:Cvel_5895.t1-p1 / transcript=Cvel_5895.t1 / gene=Cvel_5895 / organism=Chromera_velia_CCMP2878 / gene_product=hypothetical protein / transcript_product=hypothetical protein / location=Cvel_scaffold281:42907-44076(-) / protein_length=390 / sequence_SO=supercontig / SO=protein_coding / is_pseudo=false